MHTGHNADSVHSKAVIHTGPVKSRPQTDFDSDMEVSTKMGLFLKNKKLKTEKNIQELFLVKETK